MNSINKLFINPNGVIIDLSTPIVMGILNITPDSFYDGGRNNSLGFIISKITQMISEGAGIIDIGAISTRPKADIISENEEWNRLKPVLEIIIKDFPDFIFSLDTFRASIAKRAVADYGVSIINDISAGNMDNKMFSTIAELNVPYIIMHMSGTPATMQNKPTYKNVTKEIILFLAQKIYDLKLLGVKDIIIDPGFGFGKTIAHNFEILQNLEDFNILNLPLLVGISRKSMISKTLSITPDESLNGTSIVNTIAILKGAKILRVHDVKEAVEIVKITKKLNLGTS